MPLVFPNWWLRLALAVAVLGPRWGVGLADEKKPAPPPKITTLSPLSFVSDRTNTLSIRGFSLKDATEVRLSIGASHVPVRILDKKDAPAIKGLDAKDTGEHWVTAEVLLPAISTASGSSNVIASVSLRTPAGDTAAVSRPVVATSMRVGEREPNGGFKTAQKIEFDSRIVVVGCIQPEHDVDVFEASGRKGQTLSMRIRSAAFGSLLDPIITAYSARGAALAVLDDTGPKHEFEGAVRWPEDGPLFIVVQDANEHASDWHGYELELNRR